MKRRFLLMFVILSIFLNSTPIHATPVEDMRWVVDSRIDAINNELSSNYSGQSGLLRKLQFLTSKIMWVEFAEDKKGTHGLGYSGVFLKELREDLYRDIGNFNKSFGTAPTTDDVTQKFLPLKFTLWSEGKYLSAYEEYIKNTIPNYIENLLKPLSTDYTKLTSPADQTEFVRKNQSTLKYAYRVLNVLTTTEDDFIAISQGALNVSRSDKAFNMLSSNSDFSYLVQRGQEIDLAEAVIDSDTSVGTDGDFITRLASVSRKKDEDLKDLSGADLWNTTEPNGDPDLFYLQDTYLKILSAGAVYRPFVSKVGDSDFISALKGLYTEEADQNRIAGLFESVEAYKKPLFKTVGNDIKTWEYSKNSKYTNDRVSSQSNAYTGSADVLRIKDFLSMMDSNTLFGLVMKEGIFKGNNDDMNSYSYFSDNPTSPDLVVSKGVESDSGTKWTAPVLLYNGTEDNSPEALGALTAFILRQIKVGLADGNSLEDKMDGLVFMNAFGDIVAEDNTVILPAIANPIVYKDANQLYNPYSLSFLPYYPKISVVGSSVTMSGQKGKYLIINNKGLSTMSAIKIKGDTSYKISKPLVFNKIRTKLSEPIEGMEDPFFYKSLGEINDSSIWDHIKQSSVALMKGLSNLFATFSPYSDFVASDWDALLIQDPLLDNTKSLLTYKPETDTDNKIARYYARNMYKSLSTDRDGNLTDLTSILDHDYIFRNILLQGLNGTLYTDSYTKNIMSADAEEDASYGIVKSILHWLGKETIGAIGYTTNILGMKNFYEDKFFGPVISAIDQYLVVIFAVIMLLFLIRYLKDRESFVRLTIFTVSSAFVLLFFVKIFPLYVPTLYNAVVTNVNHKLGYDVLTLKTEKYDHTYGLSGLSEDESKFFVNGTTITLYKFTDTQLKSFMESMDIEPGTANSGSIYMVDSVNGIFFEGNSLKISTDMLFKTNPIEGGYTETDAGTAYQIKSGKVFSSALDYYMPFYQMEDGLIDSMNRLPKVFKIPPNSLLYSSGIVKDSFMFYQFVNSAPFLSPGKYDDPSYGLSIEEINNLTYQYDNNDLQTNSYDFLNLDRLLSNPTDEMKETLWYQTMKQNGFLDDDAKYWQLIESVNSLTKKFMIDLGTEVSLMSDENLIKVTSLFATTVFNQKISNWNNWAYPSNLNYQEFSLEDVYLAILTDSIDKFVSEDIDLVNYVLKEGTPIASIMMIAQLWGAFFISGVLRFLTLIIFLMIGILGIGRFALSKKIGGLALGFLKVGTSLLVLATAFYSSFGIADKLPTIPALILLGIIQIVVIYFMFVIVTSILLNITELGNGNFKANLDSINKGLGKLTGRIVPIPNRRVPRNAYSKYREMYRFGSNMDDSIVDYIPAYNRSRYNPRRQHEHESVKNYYDDEKISEIEELRRERKRLREEQNLRRDDLGV